MADYSDLDTPSASETPPPNAPSGRGNRTFQTLISILGVIFLIALALMATYLLVIRPRQSEQGPAGQAKLMAEATATSLAATRDTLLQANSQTPGAAVAGFPTSAETPLPPAATTPALVVIPSLTQPGYPAPLGQAGDPVQVSSTPLMIDARTATVAALLTQAAMNAEPTQTARPTQPPQPTSTARTPAIGGASVVLTTQTPVPTATALPQTGFVEDAGIPGLMGIAVALLIVIVVARGLRTRTSQ